MDTLQASVGPNPKRNQISGATWNDFGDHVTFHEENKAILVSRWIGSIADGNVIVVPCPEENFSSVIIVSMCHSLMRKSKKEL